MRRVLIGSLLCCLGWAGTLRAADAPLPPTEPATKVATQITLNVKVMELSCTKLREAGIDFSEIIDGQKPGGHDNFAGFLQFLKRKNFVRIEAEPTLVTTPGRMAYFHSGTTVSGRKVGTEVELMPTLLDGGRIRLDVVCTNTQVDPTTSIRKWRKTIPGFKTESMAPGFDIDPGKMGICGGPILSAIDPKTGKTAETRMIFVVIPEVVTPAEK